MCYNLLMVDYNKIGQKRTEALISSMAQTRAEILEKYRIVQGDKKNHSGWDPFLGYWKIKDSY